MEWDKEDIILVSLTVAIIIVGVIILGAITHTL